MQNLQHINVLRETAKKTYFEGDESNASECTIFRTHLAVNFSDDTTASEVATNLILCALIRNTTNVYLLRNNPIFFFFFTVNEENTIKLTELKHKKT